MERAVIVDGARTPFGRLGGELAEQQSFELAGLAIKKRVEDVDAADIDELLLGVGIVGSGAIAPARRSLHEAGPPLEISSNVNGGAVAIAHPVGASGARITYSLSWRRNAGTAATP